MVGRIVAAGVMIGVHVFLADCIRVRDSIGDFAKAIELDGKLENDVITGTYRRTDKTQFELQYRLTRRSDLPDT